MDPCFPCLTLFRSCEFGEQPRWLRHAKPRSEGAVETGAAYAAAGIGHRGAAAHATGDFGDKIGTLRLDYVLPSTGLRLVDSGVYWPASTDPARALVTASEPRLVWVARKSGVSGKGVPGSVGPGWCLV